MTRAPRSTCQVYVKGVASIKAYKKMTITASRQRFGHPTLHLEGRVAREEVFERDEVVAFVEVLEVKLGDIDLRGLCNELLPFRVTSRCPYRCLAPAYGAVSPTFCVFSVCLGQPHGPYLSVLSLPL